MHSDDKPSDGGQQPERFCSPEDRDLREFYDVNECAARYAVSPSTWRRLSDTGKAPQPREFGRLRRWRISELDAWDAAGNKPPGLKMRRRS
ncbi:Helix-turn-helix domain protein [Posidoniimonas corsicana]|uniref:Helix-turn-helix domain protein n=1 Tax=Posidoniimonas corsicana TaxID=1938618 RepID=A0A5C5V775_9BACT|nr:helix-turn-helix domain-containing protein [Posidoniimonas corsicana]TWT33759.1 Helix-turn-helix domain protein [Posidoniimonas corsicana]